MALPTPTESGELKQRSARPDETTIAGQRASSREQYAPDNRKVPPEPSRPHEGDSVTTDPGPTELYPDAFGAAANTISGPDGSVMFGLLVGFTPPEWWGPASRYDIYAADEADFAADCFLRVGSVTSAQAGKTHDHFVPTPQLVKGRTYTVALVPVNADGAGIEPAAAPQVTGVAFTDTGAAPPDVAGFALPLECCNLLASWTAVPQLSNDVAYYEIRQGAAWVGGALVLRVWGWNQNQAVIHLGQIPNALVAPDDEFHIRAVSRLGATSVTEGSVTLTAEQIAAMNAFCCHKSRTITPTPGADSVTITSLAPIGVAGPPIVNVGPMAIGGGGGGPLGGAPDESSFTPNGSRWDYVVFLKDTAITGDTITVIEGSP